MDHSLIFHTNFPSQKTFKGWGGMDHLLNIYQAQCSSPNAEYTSCGVRSLAPQCSGGGVRSSSSAIQNMKVDLGYMRAWLKDFQDPQDVSAAKSTVWHSSHCRKEDQLLKAVFSIHSHTPHMYTRNTIKKTFRILPKLLKTSQPSKSKHQATFGTSRFQSPTSPSSSPPDSNALQPVISITALGWIHCLISGKVN